MKKTYLFSILAALVLTGCPIDNNPQVNKYTIQFNDYNGTNLQTLTVEENVIPTYTGANPTRDDDANYSYTFSGWNPTVVAATKDATYVATYTATALTQKYTIKFVNYDNSELLTIQVPEGQTPVYTGADPSRANDGDTKYTFEGWTPELAPVTGPATYVARYSESIEYGVKTIAEVKELCKTVTGLNQSGIAVDKTRKVTIKGLAIAKMNLVKTTSKFGLNESAPGKVFIGDSTGMIACASDVTNDGTSLWGKVGDYAGQSTSKYEITGYLSMYLNQPELFVEKNSFAWNQNLDVSFDLSATTKDVLTLEQFYDTAVATNYNCAGHGYNEIYKINGLRVIDHRDKVYVCTDGQKMIKVFANKTAMTDGRTYDITGYISLNNWVPALSALEVRVSATETLEIAKSAAVSITIDQFRAIKGSKEDTSAKQDTFIRCFANLYKANVYVSCYTEGGKYYATVSDKYDSSENIIEGDDKAVSSPYNMIAISNKNYWNMSSDELERYCPVRHWMFNNETIEFYFVPFLQEFRTYNRVTNPFWKVFAINSMLPELPILD